MYIISMYMYIGGVKSSLPRPQVSPLEQQKLFSLHRDVGEKNSQLVEPQTPDFKPSPEWVSYRGRGKREEGKGEVFG